MISLGLRALHLGALWTFAVLQPTLWLLGDNVDFFFGARRVDGAAFIAVVSMYAVLPPVVLWLIEVAADRWGGRRLGLRVHLVFVAGLAALTALYALKTALGDGGRGTAAVLGLVAVAVGIGFTLPYRRSAGVRSFVSFLAPAPVVACLVFFFFTPAKDLLFPDDAVDLAPVVDSETPVVMVIFDELPVASLLDAQSEIDAARFPGFARLAEDATWYRNAAGAADYTVQAVPPILTGNRHRRGTIPVSSDHPESLFTLLGASHEPHVIEYATQVCHPDLCPNQLSTPRRMLDLASAINLASFHALLPGGAGIVLPEIGRTWQEGLASEDPRDPPDLLTAEGDELGRWDGQQFERFLDGIDADAADPGEKPPLHVLHSSAPHIPWWHLPSGAAYVPRKRETVPGLAQIEDRWSDDQRLVDQAYQRHLVEAQFADGMLEELTGRLKELGIYRRALVVVTVDHGISFRAGGRRRHLEASGASDVTMVPLFVKAPGQRQGRIDDRYVETIDVLPTIADHLGVDLPWEIDGRSFADPDTPGRRRVTPLARDVGEMSFEPSMLERQRRRTVTAKLRLFGEGATFFTPRPARSLLGRRATAGRGLDASASLDDPGLYEAVDPNSRFTPALVEGAVTGPDSAAAGTIAVAVNGRIEGVAPTFPLPSGRGFKAMVRPQSLKPGANEIAVFAVSGEGRPKLLRLGVAGG